MEHIKESLGTVHQEPFLTWNSENRNCSVCGEEFEAKIPSRNGKELHSGATKCQKCLETERDEEEKLEREEKLRNAIDLQRLVWEEKCNLDLKFVSKTFDNFDRKLQPKAYDSVKVYYDSPDIAEEKSLVLLSPDIYGLGKTHLVAALVNHIIETKETAYISRSGYVSHHPCPVYYITETKLLARIRKTYDRGDEGETETEIYNNLESVELLIIDDVGKVRPRDYSFLQGVYFRVIDDRYVNEKPIILTTNLDYKELEEHIGGACADRLREMCGSNFIKMSGESYRKKK